MNDNRSIRGKVAGECSCECHKPGSRMVHFAPCCYTCRHCGLDFEFLAQHEMVCRGVPAITLSNERRPDDLPDPNTYPYPYLITLAYPRNGGDYRKVRWAKVRLVGSEPRFVWRRV